MPKKGYKWNDKHRSNASTAQKIRYEDPAEIEKTRQAILKSRRLDPSIAKRQGASLKKIFEDPVERDKKRKRFEDPLEGIKHGELVKKAYAKDPSIVKKQNIRMKRLYENPAEREKTSIMTKQAYINNPLLCEKARLKTLTHIKFYGDGKWGIGKHEIEILDHTAKDMNIIIERGYIIAGYKVDGYCVERNIVFEVDERYHNNINQNKKDVIRQKIIEDRLGCKFIRIDEQTWLKKYKLGVAQ